MRISRFYILSIVAFPLFWMSCKPKPSAKEVEDVLNKAIATSKNEKASLFTIANVKKMDGVAGENGGVKTYQMQFSYDVIAKEDVVNFTYNLFGTSIEKSELKSKYIADSTKLAKISPDEKWSSYHQNVLFLKKGEKSKSDTGTIMLKKTEKGWATF